MPLAARYAKLLAQSPKRAIFQATRDSFPKQAALIQDESTYIAALCGRRAGKTTAALERWHVVRQRKPGLESVYIGLTRESAKAIAWSILQKQNRDKTLGLSFNKADLTVTDARGSTLRLVGANRDDLLDVLRGRPFQLVIIDEAAFYRLGLLPRLIAEVVEPALIDHSGQLMLLGTPGLTKNGLFYRATTGLEGKWSRHSWTMLDNSYLPGAPQWLESKKRQESWTDLSPVYQREYLGLWAFDPNAQVYPIDDANVKSAMPESWTKRRSEWITVLGIDYGVRNATTHVLTAYNKHEHSVYVVTSRRDVGMLPTEASDVTRRWQTDWDPTHVVGDAGGLGKVYVQYANLRGGLAVNVDNAKKLDKRGHQEWLRDAILSKRYFVVDNNPGNRELIEEMQQLQWEPKNEDDPQYHQREDPRGKKDLCDAALYSFVECHAYFPLDRPLSTPDPDDDLRPVQNGMEYLA